MPLDPSAERDDAPKPSVFYRLAWSFYLALAVAGVIWVGSSNGSIPLSLFFNSKTWSGDAILGLLAGLALVALWDLGSRFVAGMRDLEKELASQIGQLDSYEAFALAMISGFSEELFFRGAIQSSWGWAWAVVIFTAMHLGTGKAFHWWTAFAFLAGLAFGGLTLLRGNILAAIIAHIVVNGVNLRRLVFRDQL